ncbi:MAG: hypothetical protein JXL80_08155, partial [Planctomycetes bacterium]|nr:hypothetical protein [Planctomycetota bacterium]
IKQEIGEGCLLVGDTIITVVGSFPQSYTREGLEQVLLWIGGVPPDILQECPPRTSSYDFSRFVAGIVCLRAMGSRSVVRHWLAAMISETH